MPLWHISSEIPANKVGGNHPNYGRDNGGQLSTAPGDFTVVHALAQAVTGTKRKASNNPQVTTEYQQPPQWVNLLLPPVSQTGKSLLERTAKHCQGT